MQHQRQTTNDNICIMILNGYSVAVAVTSCNYTQNLDINGFFSYPRDFIGIKDTFKLGERICTCLAIQGGLKVDLDYELKNAEGEVIDNFSVNNSYSIVRNYIANEKESDFKSVLDGKERIKNLKRGSYLVDWYNGGKLIASLHFNISDKN